MSEAKFTKGAWYVQPNGVGCGGVAIVHTPNGCVIPKSEDVANRYLIAAAPEMYKALEDAAREVHILIDEVNDQRASHINQATETEPDYYGMESVHNIQVLLAKARGES